MSTDLFPRAAGGVTDSLDERARRAVHAFRALQPVLTAYARSMTGKSDVRVEMSTTDNGSTDGKRIFLRPPLALGDNSRHNRHICNKRGSDGFQLCDACAVRESVLRSIYHEIAHIAFGSFERVSQATKDEALVQTFKEMRSDWAEQARKRIKNDPNFSYVQLAQYVNKFLPFLLNCMEDARVDAQMFKVRPGTRHMFEADTLKIFKEGFENLGPNGYEMKKWSEAPLNSQLMIGTYLKASGYEYSDYFYPDVVEALNDQQVTEIVEQVRDTKLASDVYRLSLHVFSRYRELGFFATDEDKDPEQQEVESESQQESSDSGDSSESQAGAPDPSQDSDSQGSPSSDPGSDEVDSTGQGSDDERQGEHSVDADESSREESSPDDDTSDESDAGTSEQGGDEVDEQEQGDESRPEQQAGNGDGDNQDVDESEGGADHSGDDHEAGNSSDSDPSSGDEGTSEDDADSAGQSADSEWNEGSGPEQGGSGEASGDEEASADSSSGSEEPVDQGADDGYGGTDLESEMDGKPEMGEPDDIEQVISLFGDHDEKPKSVAAGEEAHAIDKAVIQGIYFNKPSQKVFGVREHYIDKHAVVNGVDYSVGWYQVDPARAKRTGKSYDDQLDEAILQPVLGEVRRAFTDNQRGKRDPNRKSGKINPAALGKRAWNDDPRLFVKNTRPGKKSYAVVLHMDLSGSTVGRNLALEKRAVLLQAEVLNRAGIPFAIIGHTGNYLDASDRYATSNELVLEIYHIKDFDQPWEEAKYALKNISGHGVNLDGHALEYLRKLADSHRATDKIIMYYSDGKMPSTNHDEELDILQDEIKTCRDMNHTLLGVGIRTDSPSRHGLPTVQVDQDSDLAKVVQHLGRRLSETR